MRLFIAIELPEEARTHLVQLAEDLKSKISKASFTRPENLHITLKFLGEVGEKHVVDLIESLVTVRVGGAVGIFADKIECLPNRGPVRIVAAGFGGSLTGLNALHAAVEQQCRRLGFERENRAYRPHVTLARARPTLPANVRRLTAALPQFSGPPFRVTEFSLIRSRLEASGALYEEIERFRLES